MGSIVAQDVLKRKLDAILLSVPGVTTASCGRSTGKHKP